MAATAQAWASDVHVQLPHAHNDLYLDVGLARYEARSVTKLNSGDHDHVFEAVPVSSEAVSHFYARTPAVVSLPTSGPQALPPLQAIKLWIPQTQPASLIVTATETALALSALSAQLRSLDVSVAAKVIAAIEGASSPGGALYDDLVQLTSALRAAQTGGGSFCSTESNTSAVRKVHTRYALEPAVKSALKGFIARATALVQNTPELADKKWTSYYARPCVERQGSAAKVPADPDVPAVSTSTPTNEEHYVRGSTGDWRLEPSDPGGGLFVYPKSLTDSGGRISFEVRNVVMRFYSVYVTFYSDEAGTKLISSPQVGGHPYPDSPLMQALDGAGLSPMFQDLTAHPGQYCVGLVGSVWTIAGIPVPVDVTTISFPWADHAACVRIRFGSLGLTGAEGDRQSVLLGELITAVVNFAIPIAFAAATARLDTTKPFVDLIKANPKATAALATVIVGELGRNVATQGVGPTLVDVSKLAGSIIGKMIVKKALLVALQPIITYIVVKLGETTAEDAVPLVGEALVLAAELIDGATLSVATGEVVALPAVVDLHLKKVIDVDVVLSAPAKGATSLWPSEATRYRVAVSFVGTKSVFVQNGEFPAALLTKPSQALDVRFTGLPAGAPFTIEAALYGADGVCCSIYRSDKALPANSGAVPATFTYVLHPLTATTVHVQDRALSYDGTTLDMRDKPPVLQGTVQSLGSLSGQGFRWLGSLAIDGWNNRLGYTWVGAGQTDVSIQEFEDTPGRVATTALSGTIQTGFRPLSVFNPFPTKAGTPQPQRMWLDPTGGSPFHLRSVEELNHKLVVAQTKSWASFAVAPVDAVVHRFGFAAAIGGEGGGLLVAQLGSSPVDDSQAPTALPVVPPGTRTGMLDTPVAITATADGRLLVLEDSPASGPSIQAFDVTGALVPSFKSTAAAFQLSGVTVASLDGRAIDASISAAFAAQHITLSAHAELLVRKKGHEWLVFDRFAEVQSHAWIIELSGNSLIVSAFSARLDLPTGFTPLDVACEFEGFIYVTSYTSTGSSPDDYRLDVFSPIGVPVCSTTRFNVRSLAVDLWRYVYTLDFDGITVGTSAQPRVSLWIPQ